VTAILTEGHDRTILLVGGVMASTSLVLQAVAWLFPLEDWLNGIASRVELDRMLADEAPDVADAPSGERAGWFSSWRRHHATPAAIDDGRAAPLQHHAAAPNAEESFLAPEPTALTPEHRVARRRWILTRMLGGLIAFAAAVAAVGALITMADGTQTMRSMTVNEFNRVHITQVQRDISGDDKTRLAMATVLCAGLAWMGFRKTTRWRKGGFYREWIWPVMLVGTMVAIAGSIVALKTGTARNEGAIVAWVVLNVAALSFLCLLVIRGRTWPRPDQIAEEPTGSDEPGEPDEAITVTANP
jgi:hypothetical protein